jgi:hypothetical protein
LFGWYSHNTAFLLRGIRQISIVNLPLHLVDDRGYLRSRPHMGVGWFTVYMGFLSRVGHFHGGERISSRGKEGTFLVHLVIPKRDNTHDFLSLLVSTYSFLSFHGVSGRKPG